MSVSRSSSDPFEERRPALASVADSDPVKPRLRGWIHLGLFEVSLVVGTLLIVAAHGPRSATATAIYAVSLSGLFGASALYHRGNWSAVVKRRLQRIDHAMIFVLFAGSATPLFLLAVPGAYGVVCLGVLWALAAVAASVHLLRMHAPDWVLACALAGLSGVGALALPGVWQHVGVAAAVLVVIGGALYVIGALSLHRHRPDPWPSVFGYHEVFHAYVGAAAACHYVAIALVVR
ncbi:MAG: hemolysin [Frankiales bacterium]|nr:hemolysin [Frankiales bacterium]